MSEEKPKAWIWRQACEHCGDTEKIAAEIWLRGGVGASICRTCREQFDSSPAVRALMRRDAWLEAAVSNYSAFFTPDQYADGMEQLWWDFRALALAFVGRREDEA